ncbi:hypothetical protein LTR78_010343 [Recurvomyces mirabilis]|uniref:Heterokaryon incompatibility domain-containing protein n=1 Tax=Recurvomyces mirabilis TaxID=574656 RepID=A0AAE0TN05_9PEZI|nr:hypothetical protein LTR78_010343 [Recurvomyces mirabilis]KAK5156216.1 hypothetical protein LTS14_005103 [Recurvomyces mirabilis]
MSARAPTTSRGPQSYSYNKLQNRQWSRIVRLWPAPERQVDIDCEIIELPSLKRSTTQSDADPTSNVPATGQATKVIKGLPGYDALSWYWGENKKDRHIRIHVADEAREFPLSQHLYDALHSLRDKYKSRYLWVDSLCIDQDNVEERNQQVPRMSEIYGDADNVCIWLGVATAESTEALRFVKNELKIPWKLGEVWRSARHHGSWVALLELMKRDWFSRRWVVQEVALAKKATIHCGRNWVRWSDFETAVSIFVELEMATRRLPAVPRADHTALSAAEDRSTFKSVPNAGASILVDITSRLLRKTVAGVHQRSISLEELVAKLAAQETSEPRDIIYALLALAKDTQPSLEGIATQMDGNDGLELTPAQQKSLQLIARLIPNPTRRRYVVEYKQPIVNVYQQFIAFSLSQADPTRALDVILRPFARTFKESQNYTFDKDAMTQFRESGNVDVEIRLPSWIPNAKHLPFQPLLRRRQTLEDTGSSDQIFIHSVERQKGESFVGAPGSRQTSYCAAGTRAYDRNKVRFRKRSDHFSLFAEGFILDTISVVEGPAIMGNIPGRWTTRWKDRVAHDWDTVWKTLVANRDSEGRNPPPFYASALLAAFEYNPEDTSYDTESISREGGAELVAKAMLRVKATIYERCLIETGRRMLGLANSDVEPDDVVCILYGCSVPVIMRRSAQKSSDAIDKEKLQDEADHRERLVRVRPLLERIFKRRRTRRGADHGNESVLGQAELPAHEASDTAPAGGQSPTNNAGEGTTDVDTLRDHRVPDEPGVSIIHDLADPVQTVAGASDARELDRPADVVGDHMQPHATLDRIRTQLVDRPAILRLISLPAFALLAALLLGEPMVAYIVTAIAGTHIIYDASSQFVENTSLATIMSVGSLVAASVLGSIALRVSPTIFCLIFAAIALLFPEMFPPGVLDLQQVLVLFIASLVVIKSDLLDRQLQRDASDAQHDILEAPHGGTDNSAEGNGTNSHSIANVHSDTTAAEAHVTQPKEPDIAGNGHVRKQSRPVKPAPKPEDSNAEIKPPKYFYTLIGEAYIHGMMDGEAIEWQNETALPQHGPRVQAEIFEIR